MSLPDLSIHETKKIRLFDNIVKNNNSKTNQENNSSFLISGSGIFMLATNNVEVFNNNIMDNKTFGIYISIFHWPYDKRFRILPIFFIYIYT